MPVNHIVQSGEHLPAIAASYGYATIDPIWGAKANEALAKVRDPHQLLAGDVLVIPDKDDVTYGRPINQTHKFVVDIETLQLKIAVSSFDQQNPIDDTNATLLIGDASTAVSLDAIDQPVERADASATLANAEVSLALRIGGLDPPDSDSGVDMRLMNLGYMLIPDDDQERKLALEELQIDNGLTVTGTLDDATRAKLVEVYGV
jgi:hypothetical protein